MVAAQCRRMYLFPLGRSSLDLARPVADIIPWLAVILVQPQSLHCLLAAAEPSG